jgi:hypothetical protein
MHHEGERGASVPRSLHLVRHNLEGDSLGRRALPANRLRGHLDEIDEPGTV